MGEKERGEKEEAADVSETQQSTETAVTKREMQTVSATAMLLQSRQPPPEQTTRTTKGPAKRSK